MRRALPSSMIATISSPAAKRRKMTESDNTTANHDLSDTTKKVMTIPRSYQTELMEQAKLENLIVCLPTGSGKTYIAVMLIKEMAHAVRASIDDGGKRTVFLVKTVALVQQQSEYIRIHTDLSVGKYYGELGVDLWNKQQWIDEFEHHQVLIFTAQVFLNLVDHNYFPLDKVNLLIFDECHHSTGENCYAALINRHYDKCHERPRILGLTASISAKKLKPHQLSKAAREVETTYRARIASGSDRQESNQCGTSVRVEPIFCLNYKQLVCTSSESVMIAFEIIESILLDLRPYLKRREEERAQHENDLTEVILTTDYLGKNITNYNACSVDYTIFLQSQYVSVSRLKHYLDNLIHIGYELGLYGLFSATKALQKLLKSSQALDLITDPKGKELFDDSVQRIDCLIDDIMDGLVAVNQNNDDILFSSKVLQLFQRLKDDIDNKRFGRCIIFVERVYTASVLSQVLTLLSVRSLGQDHNHLKIKYVTGPRANLGETRMTEKHLREVIQEFRGGKINVLVATSVVEEGLDIPECNLVFRFNKPSNFSSYMQSKGRARAKQNASYVLLIDEPDEKAFEKDSTEYRNYEEIEKMLQEEFSINDDDDDLNNDDLNQLEPYRIENGVVISAIRAAQIIYEYCAVLGNGRLCPPRILFHRNDDGTFTSILSMPANCPVREDIICEKSSKKLAKFACCLKMVELLHQRGELNEDCLPRHTRALMTINIPIDNQLFKLCDELFEKKSDSTMENIHKQIATFPQQSLDSLNTWYLYRITIRSVQDTLGFVVPSKLIELPNFNLYAASTEILVVDMTYLQTIDYTKHRQELEQFSRYLFENVFDEMANSPESIHRFDMEHSSFKLLPCLLKNDNEIDGERMLSICNRLNRLVEHPNHLSDSELYVTWHLSYKQFLIIAPDISSTKRTSDLWKHKTNSEKIQTYADHFQEKVPNVLIQRDALMVEMKVMSKPRINYLCCSSSDATLKNATGLSFSTQSIYYPIELLHYASVHRTDLELFQKLPAILVRITQLYYIEQLRLLFASSLKCYQFMDVLQTQAAVSFTDCLKKMTSSSIDSPSVTRPTILPLVPLTYDFSIVMNESTHRQPCSEILFQAVTRRSSGESMDNENLEVLGDCFLKLAVSMSLYYRHPLAGAGLLTEEKKQQISNENLYRLAVQKQLRMFLNVKKIEFRGKNANWLPPGYKTDETKVEVTERYMQQNAKRKAFSDMIEAFIGAFLLTTDYTTTMKFMCWLGLDAIPFDDQGQAMKLPSILCATTTDGVNNQIIDTFFVDRAFAEIESKINYVFRNRAYLIAAFTHPSNFANRTTDCYERLEFLGDAVLDFLVTRHVFVNYNQNVTPGRVTDIRQDLSNNGRLAYVLVACGLHTKILHNSPDLFGNISSYAGDEDLFPINQSTDEHLSKDLDQWADTTAPKALADVFEALVGAIFLDSGNCLETVWRACEPLLRKYIDQSMAHPNLNPIRSFSERGGTVIRETVDTSGDKPMTICVVQTPNGIEFEGRASNKKLAKADACQKAMKHVAEWTLLATHQTLSVSEHDA